jgi:cytochrome c-type protein NapB
MEGVCAVSKLIPIVAAAAGLTLVAVAVAPGLLAQTADLESLRGRVTLEATSPAPDVKKQNTASGRFTRAYRQQPPMIPHRIEQYEIDLKVNQCLRCHDWPYNVEENAPKISETHYTNRDGIALDRVAGTRWFCLQCHVPQTSTRSLVDNDFKSAAEVD